MTSLRWFEEKKGERDVPNRQKRLLGKGRNLGEDTSFSLQGKESGEEEIKEGKILIPLLFRGKREEKEAIYNLALSSR